MVRTMRNRALPAIRGIGLGCLLERHGLDHRDDAGQGAELQRRLAGRRIARECAFDRPAAE
jgi:hypothetical protein